MKLYVIRHGETLSNLSGVVSGRSDEGLTENGIKQAQELNTKLEKISFDAVYVSPMKRTIETANIIVPEYQYVIDERIAERDLGSINNRTIDELWELPLWNSLTEKRTAEGAETFASGLERVEDFLASLKKQFSDKKDAKILLITHSFVSRCLWAIKQGVSEDLDYTKFHHKNNEIVIYDL